MGIESPFYYRFQGDEKKMSKEITSGIYNKGDINIEDILKSIKNNPIIEGAGSILTFTGIVRNTSKDGNPIKGLNIDAYDELANKSIKEICEDIKKKEGIIDIIIIHFKGEFKISEDLVYVIVTSAHREEGFKMLRTAVERYKKEIAVWKREDFKNGSSDWIH